MGSLQSVRRTGLELCASPRPCLSPQIPPAWKISPVPIPSPQSPTQHDTLPALGISIRPLPPPARGVHPTTAHPLVRKVTPTNPPSPEQRSPFGSWLMVASPHRLCHRPFALFGLLARRRVECCCEVYIPPIPSRPNRVAVGIRSCESGCAACLCVVVHFPFP